MMKKVVRNLSVALLTIAVFGLPLWSQAKNHGESVALSVPPGTLVFRAVGGMETKYFIFKANLTYSLLVRMHMGTMEFDHGTWEQDEEGQMTLTSQNETNTISHVNAIRYKSYVALYSPDQGFIKIYTPTADMLKSSLDKATGRTPLHIFTQVNPELAAMEASTPQPFIFYPELNGSRPHPIQLQKGSPLTPNKTMDGN